jgi:hypothetical protein
MTLPDHLPIRNCVVSILFVCLGLAGLAVPETVAQSSRERVEAEIVTLRPHGFEPKEIKRPAGHFLLSVDTRSGLKEVTWQLDRVAGSRLREVRVSRNKLDWRELVDLTPGTYKLTEASHPNWVCTITLTNRSN